MGRAGGLKTATIPGALSRAGAKGGKKGGHVQGLVNAANGHLLRCMHLRWHVYAGKTPKKYCPFCKRGRRNVRWQGNRLVSK